VGKILGQIIRKVTCRRSGPDRFFAGRWVEPSSRNRHAWRSWGWAKADRCSARGWRVGRLPPGTRRPGRPMPAPRKDGRGPLFLW